MFAALEVFAMVATFVCPPRHAPPGVVQVPSETGPMAGITLAFSEACPSELCMTSRPSYGECGGPMGCRVML